MDGDTPTVAYAASSLGLSSGDALSAFCLDNASGTVLFTLAAPSPTLGRVGAGPADLLLVVAPASGLPTVFAGAAALGLAEKDLVDALKCLLPEVDRFTFSLWDFVIQGIPVTSRIPLSGPASVHVAVSGAGDAKDTGSNGLEDVATEMVQLDLRGNSPMGPVTVTLRDPALCPHRTTVGAIEEAANNTPDRLDLPPFACNGTADSFFDVFSEVHVGDQVYHHHAPLQLRQFVSHKPPACGEVYKTKSVVPLLLENDQPANLFLFAPQFHLNPPIQTFDLRAVAILRLSGGVALSETPLFGNVTLLTFVDNNGTAEEKDGDGLDEARTEIASSGEERRCPRRSRASY